MYMYKFLQVGTNDVQVQQFSSPSQVQVRMALHQVKSSPSPLPKKMNQVKSKSDVKKNVSSQVQVKSTYIKVKFPICLITPNM